MRRGPPLAFHIDVGGWVWVYRHGDGTLAPAEVAYTESDGDDAPADDPAFLRHVSGPPAPDATDAGVVDAPSGALAILPAPSSGAPIAGAAAVGGGECSDSAETGLVVTGTAAPTGCGSDGPSRTRGAAPPGALLVPVP